MGFVEVDLFGVYVAPISMMLGAAQVVTIALRRVAGRFGGLRHVWHPAVFIFAVYVIVLSSMVLVAALRLPCRMSTPNRSRICGPVALVGDAPLC
jgi:protein AaeX